MSLFFVTGIAGSGKSTVRKELLGRGYEAYDSDEDGFSRWQNITTGEITRVAEAGQRTPEFSAENQWRVDPERVKQLVEKAAQYPIFLCGSFSNDLEVWGLFAKVIYLDIDKATIQRRITDRTTSDYGKNPNEIAGLMDWHERLDNHFKQRADFIVDASRPIAEVVDAILKSS